MQECNKLLNFLIIQIDTYFIFSHCLDDFIKSSLCSIMEIRSSQSYITQARYFGTMSVSFIFCFLKTSIILNGQLSTSVCEIVMLNTQQFIRLSSHIFSNMTSGTVIFLEQIVASQFICSHSSFISFQVFIETRVRSKQCSFKFLNSIGNIRLIKAVRIYFLKSFREVSICIQFFTNLIKRSTCHFHRIQRRTSRLISQSCCTSIPKLHKIIMCIIYRRSIYTTKLSTNSFRILLIIHSSGIQTMTRRTRNRIV